MKTIWNENVVKPTLNETSAVFFLEGESSRYQIFDSRNVAKIIGLFLA